jgi:hypothetical protein
MTEPPCLTKLDRELLMLITAAQIQSESRKA